MNWLNKYKTTRDPQTHLSFNGGKYYVSDEHMDEFYKKYYQTMIESTENLYLIEKIYDSTFAFFLDIELNKKEYSPDINIQDRILQIIKATKLCIDTLFESTVVENNDNDDETMKLDYHIISKRNNKYHINFPNLIVNKGIALIIINKLKEFVSPSIMKLIDTSVYNTGLRMLGSQKSDSTNVEEKKKYGDTYESIYKICKEDGTIVNTIDISYNLFMKTVIRRKSDVQLSPLKNEYMSLIKTETKEKNKISLKGINNPKVINELIKLLNQIQQTHSDVLPEPLKYGPIVAKPNKTGFFCFYVTLLNKHCYFKQREHMRESSPVYIEVSSCGIYVKCHDTDCLGRKYPDGGFELPQHLEKDYPELYNSICTKYWKTEITLTSHIKRILEESLSGSHYKIAKTAFEIYKDRFRIDEVRFPDWYEFDGIKWQKTHIINMLISEDLPRYYRAIKISDTSIKNDELKDYLINEDKFESNMRNEMVDSIISKLENVNFKKSILSELIYMFKQAEPNFISKLDSNPYLIGFKNGVYDLKDCTFRQGSRHDYLTFSTGYDYTEYDENLPEIKAIYVFLKQIITNKNVFEYLMKILGRSLCGIADERFYIFTGTGSNAKSTLIEFLEHTLGDYITGVDVSLLTSKRGVSSNASPDVTRIKGKRIISFAEPEHGDTLKLGILKAFSGGDTIIARELFKSPITFKSQASMIMCCNDLPTVNVIDGGFMRRLRIIDFKSKFCDSPKKINEFKIDPTIKEKLKQWRPYFMSMLIHWYNIYKQELKEFGKIFEPDEVLISTQKYKQNNDKFEEFFNENIIEDKSSFTSIKELYNQLVTWWPSNNHGIKIPLKKELERALTLKYEEPILKNKTSGYALKLVEEETYCDY